ncbi:YaiO family outer membrane beta-barrel protein [Pseudoduganella sp. DS3]|uniref:YaiO family outer membrane beta-barrel protein n=1 Tax=Pseudoduganella guangdongensis TaxID=2692179 RepID=A0A6N9HFK1_9BURK|nr:YaiO family outer membrane beta-barrel protein [Pseudoduganella guangdongensis]MYN02324.1 YaiO family outer membrane beta-barrel protein [Pseudoduganella guangdongensis]
MANGIVRTGWLVGLLWLAAGGAALAQSGSVEAGLLHHSLSDGLGQWNQQFVRGTLRTSEATVWNADLVNARQFGAHGKLAVAGVTHVFNDDWYGSLGASYGSSFFYPKGRADAVLNRKLGAARNVVATLGLTAVNARDGHRDRSVLVGLSWYLPNALVLQGGMRINRSDPGGVMANAKYVAATWGYNKQQYIAVRYDQGEEAYQYIGAGVTDLLVNFRSNVASATWRKWLGQDYGFQLRVEAYHNPYYNRRGMEAALFKEF